MPAKQQPLGICDHCLGPIPPGQWYTVKTGKPRLYCSIECRNAANSKAGAQIRSEKLKKRVQAGAWENPHYLHPPTAKEQAARARKGRLREVSAGTWRNPALDPVARKKLSRSRKHFGVLACAIEKLDQGDSVSDLTEEERQVYREYRAELREARRKEINRQARENYRRRQAAMTEAEREEQRERRRAANHKKSSD